MAIREELRESENYQLIAGIDENDDAVALRFEGRRIAIDNGDCYWKDRRYEYSAGNLIYKGTNTTHKAATTAETWYVWKYTWSGDDMVRCEGPLTGQWDNRASLSWGA